MDLATPDSDSKDGENCEKEYGKAHDTSETLNWFYQSSQQNL
jgi:hypothetical protein